MPLALTIVPWTAERLRFYELWLESGQQAAVVVAMAVGQDQRIGLARLDLQHTQVVQETLSGQAEVEQDLSPLVAAR